MVVLGIFAPITLDFIVVLVGNNIFVIYGLGCGIQNHITSTRTLLNALFRLSSAWSIASWNKLVLTQAFGSLLFASSVLF